MLKWIGGCLLVIVVVVIVTVGYGYRKVSQFAEKGPAPSVTIDASADRVFASIANADSMTEWREEGLGIRASRRGLLRPGDTLTLQQTSGTARRERSNWIVTDVTPGKLFVTVLRNNAGASVFAMRRDSLVALGESTVVVSTLVAPMLDSLKTDHADSGSAMASMTKKLMIAGMRAQSAMELRRLKARLEGDSFPRLPRP